MYLQRVIAKYGNFAYNHGMMDRRELLINPIEVNGKMISRIIVDPHARKHSEVTDEIIVGLVQKLNGGRFIPDSKKDMYAYYVSFLKHESRQYRLIWLMEDEELYIGVITAFRDSKKRR